MADARTCPDCGSELPPRAPEGLCPRCLIGAGLASDALSVGRGGDVGATMSLGSGVLETISATLGAVPRVLLRDTDLGVEPPLVRPDREKGDDSTRYRIDGEIARGGMGAVLKGRDPDLGRDVAIKVLREDLRENPDMVRRFVEEAQIGGQLQHPGIVPIYELGAFADRRPFFSMKLVKGHTLAGLLADRGHPSEGLPRFLAIFESIAQTVAYAHARGVIHRDLKPSNVMVGSFGEVQVMDWGLAKVLPHGGVADDASAGRVAPGETVIATARSGADDSDLSRAGSVLGTPSYMAPEQARGEIGRVDERADVFALGSILCEVLTGQPAFTGRSSGEIQRKAALGDTADALARLAACEADPELAALARDCLAREPEDRPREAGAVSARLTAYLSGVQERLHQAELARAAESARAEEAGRTAEAAEARARAERRARRLTAGLAASVLLVIVLGGGGAAWIARQQIGRASRGELALKEATLLRDRALAAADDPARWREALDAVKRADLVLAEIADPAARRRLDALRDEVQAGDAAARRDAELLAKVADIPSALTDDPTGSRFDSDSAYAAAFRDAGYDVDALGPERAGAAIKARPAAVTLAAALDDWAALRRQSRPKDSDAWHRLVDAARAADPDPRRDRLRAIFRGGSETIHIHQIQALRNLAAEADVETWPVQSLNLLASALTSAGEAQAAMALLRRAVVRHAGDVRVHHNLASLLAAASPPQTEEAIRYYTAARAIRPETAHALAHLLESQKRGDEALAVFRDLVRLRPSNARHWGCLGWLLQARGDRAGAVVALEKAAAEARAALRLKPDDARAQSSLDIALRGLGKTAEAAEERRKLIRLQPASATAHNDLGTELQAVGKMAEAIEEFRAALRLQPDFVGARNNLGKALQAQGKSAEAAEAYRASLRVQPDDAKVHLFLGHALYGLEKPAEAAEEFRAAIRLKADYAEAHQNLAIALWAQDRLGEACAEYRESIRLRPGDAATRVQLGSTLSGMGRLGEAVAEYREAVRLEPKVAGFHLDLGIAEQWRGDNEAAIADTRAALKLHPALFDGRRNIGLALLALGRPEEALAEFREAEKILPDHHELPGEFRMVALAPRLPAVLRGEDRPANPDERIDFANLCFRSARFAAAARLYAEALKEAPTLADDREALHAQQAARYSAHAACAEGRDDPPPTATERAALRRQALDLMRNERGAWARVLERDPKAADKVVAALRLWRRDYSLAFVREADALDKLPEPERGEWRAFWAEVDALVKKAKDARP